jgi:hypothetical protein
VTQPPPTNYVTPCCGVDVTQPGTPTIRFRPTSGQVICGNCGRPYTPDPDRVPVPITAVRLRKRDDGQMVLLLQYQNTWRAVALIDPTTFTGRADYSTNDIKTAAQSAEDN